MNTKHFPDVTYILPKDKFVASCSCGWKEDVDGGMRQAWDSVRNHYKNTKEEGETHEPKRNN